MVRPVIFELIVETEVYLASKHVGKKSIDIFSLVWIPQLNKAWTNDNLVMKDDLKTM